MASSLRALSLGGGGHTRLSIMSSVDFRAEHKSGGSEIIIIIIIIWIVSQIGWKNVQLTCPGGSHHHAEWDFFLEHGLDEHHVEVADDGAVDHHDLVALDYTWKREKDNVGQVSSFPSSNHHPIFRVPNYK